MAIEATTPDKVPEKASDDDHGAARPRGLSKLAKPYLIITGYYVGVGAVLGLGLTVAPRLIGYLPVGGASDIAAGFSVLEGASPAPVEPASPPVEAVKLALAMIGAFLLMLPVTWICMGARRRKDVSQSFLQTILVLPLVIAGVVHVVHDSLALAFSLAGIVAGVRFRHTLKDSAETTYLFTAIGVGVACGVNAVEIAAIISIFFNYAVLGLWATEFGSDATGKRMFSRDWMAKDEKDGKRKDKDENDPDEDDD